MRIIKRPLARFDLIEEADFIEQVSIALFLTALKSSAFYTVKETFQQSFPMKRRKSNRQLYAWHTKNWMKRYGTGSGSDRVVLGDAR